MHDTAKDEDMDGRSIDVNDNDIYEAMKDIPGYLDITPGDLKEIYRHAYRHAVKRLATSIKAGDVMTRDVIYVKPETPIAGVARAMAEHAKSGVPVVEQGRVVGIISEKDFLAHMGRRDLRTFMALMAECLDSNQCSTEPLQSKVARDIMSAPAVTVGESTTLAEIATIFTAKHINRVPVVDGEGIMIGIVSRDDLVKASFGGACGVL
jgi:CBS domain-containing membrane protein